MIMGLVGQGVGHQQDTVLVHGGLGMVMVSKASVVAVLPEA